jgi:L-amino acid N-acyltransferase YncA
VAEDTEQPRSSVVARYSQLAREAAAGGQVTDGEGCFGAVAYGDTAGLPDGHVDAVISNCVINLAVDKPRVLAEAFRAVRPAAPDGVLIRPMRAADAEQVLAIYQAGLDTGQASFEVTTPSWEAFDAAKLPLHRHVAADAATGRLLGWVAASPVSSRCVYSGVIEHSVYVDPACHGRGIGAALLGALVASAEDAGIWTVQSGVFPENTASLRLHERAGFRVVGTRERLACHHGQWRDVLLIERRSRVAGAG